MPGPKETAPGRGAASSSSFRYEQLHDSSPLGVAETLALLPPDLDVVLRRIGGDYEYTDTAQGWLETESDLDNHYELVSEIHFTLPDPDQIPLPEPVDLLALMSGDQIEHEYLSAPLVMKGKQTALTSKRGDGKSLLALDLSAHAATGTAFLEQPDGDPFHVIYLDMEMGADDLWARLGDFGWTPDNPLFDTLTEYLHYFQLFTLPPLDTNEGGETLERLVDRHQAELIVIDTISRVISGGENDNDTFLALNRHTEMRLKRRKVAVLRLDHLGKDPEKGARGGSAKEDPLDVIYQLSVFGDGVRLRLKKDRQGAGLPHTIDLARANKNGVMTHVMPAAYVSEATRRLVSVIDELDLPDDASTRTTQKALQAQNQGKQRQLIAAAVKFRKGRKRAEKSGNHPPEPPNGNHPPEPPGTTKDKTTSDLGIHPRNHPSEPPGTVTGNHSPSLIEGVVPDQANTEPLFDDPDDEANYGDPAL